MKENFKSGSMRGGWRGYSPWLGDLSAGGKPPETAHQLVEVAEPVAYSTVWVAHMPHPAGYDGAPSPTIQTSIRFETRVETPVSQRLWPGCHLSVTQPGGQTN